MTFKNRIDAGEQLARKLENCKDSVILAIPRGGVEVALPVALKTMSVLDIVVARKIPVPDETEVAIGAVTPDGTAVYNEIYVNRLGLTEENLRNAEKESRSEAIRRDEVYRKKRIPLKGRIAILVDDGLATGYTMLAAVRSARKNKPAKIIVAIPVASRNAYGLVRKECDEIACLHVSDAPMFAVGSFYEDFPQLTDEEVIGLLKRGKTWQKD